MKKLIIIIITFIVILSAMFIMSSIYCKIKKQKRYNDGDIVLFLGDSITARYNLDIYFPSYYTINSGIGGNMTIDILNDLDSRVYKYNPSKIFLLIGTNDIVYSTLTQEEIKDNIESIITQIHNMLPNTIIYLESIYPVNNSVNEEMVAGRDNKDIIKLNKKIKNICKNNICTYINMHDRLTDNNGNLNKIYTKDGIHINRIGYIKVTLELLKYINLTK